MRNNITTNIWFKTPNQKQGIKKMKKLLTLAVCFSAMFVFYGCGDGNASQAAKEKKEAEIKECMNNMTRFKTSWKNEDKKVLKRVFYGKIKKL